MSITYKLFGIPKTFDEFVDKSKRRGQALDVIFCKDVYEPGASTTMDFYAACFELRLGKRTLKLKELFHPVPLLSQEALAANRRYCQEDLEEAIKIVEGLQSRGVKTTVNGQPMTNVTKSHENRQGE